MSLKQEHYTGNPEVMGLIPKRSKNWLKKKKKKCLPWMQSRLLWIKSSARYINLEYNVLEKSQTSNCQYNVFTAKTINHNAWINTMNILLWTENSIIWMTCFKNSKNGKRKQGHVTFHWKTNVAYNGKSV